MKILSMAWVGILLAGSLNASAPQQRKTPYWASLSAGQARMRTGPGRNYPAIWLYQRQGLPVQVIEVYPGWRKIRDPDGESGWMITNLLSDQRTGMVKDSVVELHESPDASSKISWRAEPGVIGRLSHCKEGWCRIDAGGRSGFVEETTLWGVDPDETIE